LNENAQWGIIYNYDYFIALLLFETLSLGERWTRYCFFMFIRNNNWYSKTDNDRQV